MNEPGAHEQPEVVEAELVDDAAPVGVAGAADYEGGVPTFDYVRDRIEGRFATSVGATELAGETAEGRSIDEQLAERDRAAREKLEQLRRSMRGE
jgi:phage shock protein A